MPVSPKDNQEVRDQRREQILDAASVVFSERGLVASKIADIARVAGLSHGLVYHYFESKEHVFAALIERVLGGIRESLTAASGTPAERLEESIQRAVALTRDRPEVGRLLSQSMLLQSIPETSRLAAMNHACEIHDHWTRLLRDCQKSGAVTEAIAASELASMLLMMFRGMAIRPPGMKQSPIPLPSFEAIAGILGLERGATGTPKPKGSASKITGKKPQKKTQKKGSHAPARRPRS